MEEIPRLTQFEEPSLQTDMVESMDKPKITERLNKDFKGALDGFIRRQEELPEPHKFETESGELFEEFQELCQLAVKDEALSENISKFLLDHPTSEDAITLYRGYESDINREIKSARSDSKKETWLRKADELAIKKAQQIEILNKEVSAQDLIRFMHKFNSMLDFIKTRDKKLSKAMTA